MGIEPTSLVWKTKALPLSYTRNQREQIYSLMIKLKINTMLNYVK